MSTGSANKDVFVFFGHHKCASTYVNQVVVDLGILLGLSVRVEYLAQILPLGYHEKEPHKSELKNLLRSLETDDYDFLCHGNADCFLLDSLAKRGYRGFHVIRDPRDVLVSAYFSLGPPHRSVREGLPHTAPTLSRARNRVTG